MRLPSSALSSNGRVQCLSVGALCRVQCCEYVRCGQCGIAAQHDPHALVTGPTVKVYYSSQFAPLVIFFLVFLTIVKNTKLHHFVRFNCMQVR